MKDNLTMRDKRGKAINVGDKVLLATKTEDIVEGTVEELKPHYEKGDISPFSFVVVRNSETNRLNYRHPYQLYGLVYLP